MYKIFSVSAIDLKLLKNNAKAAQTLEDEHLYPDAASGYLKHCDHKIAYEIVARNLHKDPYFINELKSFNKKDKNLIKDIMKYSHSRRRKI